MTDDTPRDPLAAQQIVPFLRSLIASGETLSSRGIDDIEQALATRPSGDEALRAAIDAELAALPPYDPDDAAADFNAGAAAAYHWVLAALAAPVSPSPDVESLAAFMKGYLEDDRPWVRTFAEDIRKWESGS